MVNIALQTDPPEPVSWSTNPARMREEVWAASSDQSARRLRRCRVTTPTGRSSIWSGRESQRNEEGRRAWLGGLAGRRRRDGEAGPVDGLGQDSPGRHFALAAEPADDCQPLPGLQFPDLSGLGAKTHSDLQRRLLADLRREAPEFDGPVLQRMLGLGLAGHRRGAGTGGGRPRTPATLRDDVARTPSDKKST